MGQYTSGINTKMVAHICCLIARMLGLTMLGSAGVGLYHGESSAPAILWLSIGIFVLSFINLLWRKHLSKSLSKKDGYLVVALSWVVMTVLGALPYIVSGSISAFTDAFFESISGFTTTGATIITDIESLPKSILLWRSISHWLGGMGIIVLAVAILPLLGIGGMQLFVAESPGPSADKLSPRIANTAKRLWLLYLFLTIAETLLLYFAGMSLFDAVNHAMSTVSTGGFSTKNNSVAFWNDSPLIQYIMIVFMFLAGANFVVVYSMIKRSFKAAIRDEEFRVYGIMILSFTLAIAGAIWAYDNSYATEVLSAPLGVAESVWRQSLFQVLAVITTTGFVTADYTLWPSMAGIVIFGLMFIGGSSGSTSGGVKFVRHLIMIKNGVLELKRQMHPFALIPVRFNSKAVDPTIVYNILAFFVLYMSLFIVGAIVLSLTGLDFVSALGASATSIGNVGPGFGSVGPVDNFAALTPFAKLFCSLLMIIGRLELFTILILFTPFFWKDQ